MKKLEIKFCEINFSILSLILLYIYFFEPKIFTISTTNYNIFNLLQEINRLYKDTTIYNKYKCILLAHRSKVKVSNRRHAENYPILTVFNNNQLKIFNISITDLLLYPTKSFHLVLKLRNVIMIVRAY